MKSFVNIQSYLKTFKHIPHFYYQLIFNVAIVYFILLLFIECLRIFLFNGSYIQTNIFDFTKEIFLLIISLSAGILSFQHYVGKTRHHDSYEHFYEELFFILKKFSHGENLLMNLNRLSLLSQNVITFEKQPAGIIPDLNYDVEKFFDSDILERLNIAAEEFIHISLPELYRLNAKLIEMSDENLWFHDAARKIFILSKKIKKELDYFLSHTAIINNFEDSQNKLVKSIVQLKKELSILNEVVINKLSVNIHEAFSIAEAKFKSNGRENLTIISNLNFSGKKALIRCSELAEIFSILFENSFQAFDELEAQNTDLKEKIIMVSSIASCEKITLKIEDNGIGISNNLKNSVFNNGVTSKMTGHGFGLFYVKKCIEKYGGKVWCECSKLGGASIILELKSV